MADGKTEYAVVADALRGRILSGKLKPGEPLLSERRLCEKFSVSRITIRRALDILSEERLVHRRQGSGTYVSPDPTPCIPLMIDYGRSMQAHAPGLERNLLVWKWQVPTEKIADRLQLRSGEDVLYAERVDKLNGTPVAWDQAYIPRSFGSKLTERDLETVDFLRVWSKRESFSVESCDQTLEAVAVPAIVARNLPMKRGRPILRSTELYSAAADRPAGLFVSYYDPKFICVTSHFRWRHVRTRRNT